MSRTRSSPSVVAAEPDNGSRFSTCHCRRDHRLGGSGLPRIDTGLAASADVKGAARSKPWPLCSVGPPVFVGRIRSLCDVLVTPLGQLCSLRPRAGNTFLCYPLGTPRISSSPTTRLRISGSSVFMLRFAAVPVFVPVCSTSTRTARAISSPVGCE